MWAGTSGNKSWWEGNDLERKEKARWLQVRARHLRWEIDSRPVGSGRELESQSNGPGSWVSGLVGT